MTSRSEPIARRVRDALHGRARTVAALCISTGLELDQVRAALYRLAALGLAERLLCGRWRQCGRISRVGMRAEEEQKWQKNASGTPS